MIRTLAIIGLAAIGSTSVAEAMPASPPSHVAPIQGIEKTVVIVRRRPPVVVRRRPAARVIVR